MSPTPPRSEQGQSCDLTLLLNQMQRGNRAAGEQAVELVYGELHRIAARELHRERPGHVLQTTALIHEAYTRMVGAEALEIHNRMHFYAIASQQMRRILVDYARAKNAQRRGGGAVSVSLDGIEAGREGRGQEPAGHEPRGIDLLLLDEALGDLKQLDPRAEQIVELRYFGGYTDKEVADALGVSLATVRRDWEFARSWLFDRMKTSDS
jgi:RNA polymerase sigma factor (TIGR02999 family)